MIVGHAGPALIARAAQRNAPFALLLAAAFSPDLLDAAYAFARMCNPFGVYSHSLGAVGLLALLFAAAAWIWTRSFAVALLVAAVVLSHLALDLLTGEKLLWMYGPVAGLHLYRWPLADFMIETPLVAGGWLMLRASRNGPAWASTVAALCVMLATQALMDLSLRTTNIDRITRCEARGLAPSLRKS